MRKKDKQQIIAEVLNFQVTNSILDHVTDLVWVKDLQGQYVAVSESFNQLFGLENDSILGRTDQDYGFGSFTDALDDKYVIRNRQTTTSQKQLDLPNGNTLYFEVRKSPIYDIRNQVIGIVATGRDITEIVQRQEYLRYLGYHDSLTGLHNRNYFEELPKTLLRDHIRNLGMIICDIDGLKLVNDTLGHAAGDQRLKKAARILLQAVDDGGHLARIGGDEFAIVVPEASQELIDIIIHRMKCGIEQAEQAEQAAENLPLNISFGTAVGDLQTTDFFSLFMAADNAMYRDKMLHAESTRNTMVKTVIKMLSMKDFIMEGHADRLQRCMASIGQEAGLPESKINDLRLLAEFHDIGKIGIPEGILKKPGPLTDEEMNLMRRHPQVGCDIAKSIPELSPIADWILKHHEQWDGSGYPLGLKGKNIPIEARIVHIVDAYDAMTHDRPYRKALDHETAVHELRRCAGTQFDPDLVGIFLSMISNSPVADNIQ